MYPSRLMARAEELCQRAEATPGINPPLRGQTVVVVQNKTANPKKGWPFRMHSPAGQATRWRKGTKPKAFFASSDRTRPSASLLRHRRLMSQRLHGELKAAALRLWN